MYCKDKDEDNVQVESIGSALKIGVLASILAAAGVVDGAQFKSSAMAASRSQGVSSAVSDAFANSILPDASRMVGQWRWDKAVNVVSRTLYMEARGDGVAGIRMVMSVIWNRSRGKPSRLADECLREKQFSCWNSITNKTPSTYEISFPVGSFKRGSSDAAMWDKCQELAKSAVDGDFKPDNPYWNAYYNPNAVKEKPSWDKDMRRVTKVGSHKVGNLREYGSTASASQSPSKVKWKPVPSAKASQAAKPRAANVPRSGLKSLPEKHVTAGAGDTLKSIAAANHVTVRDLMSMNGLKTKAVKPGQRIRVM